MFKNLSLKVSAAVTGVSLLLWTVLSQAVDTTLGTDAAAALSASQADIVVFQKAIMGVLVLIAIGLVIFGLTRKVH